MRFSIITPSLDQGTWIEETMRSVREQAGVKVEHLVIDGGSRDATKEILAAQSFAKWISEPDGGQTDAINKGLAQSKGDILSYLCADDYLEPGALARVDGIFRENPEVDVVFGDCYFLEAKTDWKRLKRAGEFTYARLRWNNFLFQPAVFWRRAVYERFGKLDAVLTYCMDHEYWLRIGAETQWHHVPEPLATCRLHAEAKTSRALVAAWREAETMQARYGIRWKPKWDALWMATLGQYYYRAKRQIFSALGRRRA
ncbi:N/A [soil metagenome]